MIAAVAPPTTLRQTWTKQKPATGHPGTAPEPRRHLSPSAEPCLPRRSHTGRHTAGIDRVRHGARSRLPALCVFHRLQNPRNCDRDHTHKTPSRDIRAARRSTSIMYGVGTSSSTDRTDSAPDLLNLVDHRRYTDRAISPTATGHPAQTRPSCPPCHSDYNAPGNLARASSLVTS